jgi:tetratricopeptide (TPR) repeat protein
MDNNEAKSWFEKGVEEYDSKDYEEAAKCYEEAAKLAPDNANIFYNWGNALFELGKNKEDESLFKESFEKYKQATELNEDDAAAFNNWGNALSDLAKIKEDESLFKESFEKYKQATELNKGDAVAFYNWGNALSELAKIKEDELLFKESFEKYKQATELDKEYVSAFNNWGNALSDLAKIKEDESLFRESFEKYEQATELNKEDATAFNNWGTALAELAKIKEDGSLFKESFEKYKRATELDKKDAEAFFNWGTALSNFAKIKEDELLFKESFEKYKQVTELNEDDATAFNNWGVALYYLAKMREDELLLRQSLKMFEKVAQLNPDDIDIFLNLGTVLYELAKITKDESLFKEAVKNFEKSKKDILYILGSFDKEDREYIIRRITDIYPLLDSDTDDSQFFREITKNIDKSELDKYKKAYILSVYIISKLHVNNPNEKLVAHYLKKTVSQSLLFEPSKFRLNAINYFNDPTEGDILFDYLFEEKYIKEKDSERKLSGVEYRAFAGCFIFNHNSLNQFRLYGKEGEKEGTGLSFVFRKSFFSEDVKMATEQLKAKDETKDKRKDKNPKPKGEKHALFRCIYIDPDTRRVETVGQKEKYLFFREGKKKDDIDKYDDYIKDIIKSVDEKMIELRTLVENLDHAVIKQLLINLRYLTKHIAFKEEQECRIIKIYDLKDAKVKTDDFAQMYVEYDPMVSGYIDKIYFGPKADGMELFQDILIHKGLSITCKKSENPLA